MLKTTKVVGLNSDTAAALALVCQNQAPSDFEKTSLDSPRQSFYLIIYCECEDAFVKVRQTLAEAQSAFYLSDKSVPERLQESLEAIKQNLSDVENLQILLASTEDTEPSVLYLLTQGQFLSAHLIRDHKMMNLIDPADSSQLVSGLLKEGDRIVLLTQSLKELLGESWEIINHLPIENVEDEVLLRLPTDRVNPTTAIIIEKEIEKVEALEFEVKSEEKKISPREFYLPKINIGDYLIAFFKTIKVIFTKVFLSSPKRVAFLGVILVIAAIGLKVFSSHLQQENQISDSFKSNYNKAAESYQKALTLKDSDSQNASASLISAQNSLKQALKIKPYDSQALDLQKKIGENTGGILKIYPVKELKPWLDLDLVKKGMTAQQLSLSRGEMLVLDTSKNTAVLISTDTKSNQILAGAKELGESKLASLNSTVGWVLSEDKGLVKIDTVKESASVVIKPGDWGKIADIFGFAGNIYLLDTNKNQIWKYLPVENGYSDKREYFAKETKVDLSKVKKMQIDSSIWLLKDNGEVLKYTQGVEDSFFLKNLDRQLQDPKSIFISDQTENLYILDNGNKRLVVFDKEGNYRYQYTSDSLANVTDLAVDEQAKKIYLLEGSKIFQLDVK
jgi:hypothetical protein